MIDPQLDGRVAVVTGANHGLGAAIVNALASQGAKVFITYCLLDCPYSEDELEEAQRAGMGGDSLYRAMRQQSGEVVLNDIHSRGDIAVAHEFDLGDADNITKLFDLCES